MSQGTTQSQKDPFIFDLNKDFEEEEDNNDLINIQLSSNSIQVYYYQMCKYSQLVQNEFPKKEAMMNLPRYVQEIQKKYKINDDNFITFFRMIQEEKVEIKINQYCDLCRLSQIFQVQILQKVLKRYAKKYSSDIEYIINLLIEHHSKTDDTVFLIDDFSNEMEELLVNNIDRCLQNQNFKNLPISVIHRIIQKSGGQNFSSDILYEFITESIESRSVLFSFIKIRDLSENNFDDLYKKFLSANENGSSIHFRYLSADIAFIKSLKEEKNKIQIDLGNKINELESNNRLIQIEVEKRENDNKSLLNKVNLLENENHSLQDQINHSKSSNDSLQNRIAHLESVNESLRNELNQSNNKNIENCKQIERLKIDQKWNHEYNLMKLKKSNDDNCYVKIIKKLLSNINFENDDDKSKFYKNNILNVAAKSGTTDLVDVLNSNQILKSAKISCIIYFMVLNSISLCLI